MLTSRFPYPLEKGDKLRAFHQLKRLSSEFNVTLVSITDEPVDRQSIDIISHYTEEVYVFQHHRLKRWYNMCLAMVTGKPFQVGYFYSLKTHRAIRAIIKRQQFDHIYCQLIRMAEYVKNEHQLPKTLDYMDALSAGIQRRIAKQNSMKRWLFQMEYQRLREYESRAFDFFEHKTIISEQDRDLIFHSEINQIKCIPNGIDQRFFEELNIEKTHDFVFIGNMSYPPNIEAVEYIQEHILPRFPDSSLLISGSNPHKRVQQLAKHPRIDLTGWVDDIRTSYQKGRIFLAPMMIGTGMQNKLLEAMASGTPCVTTSLANNAIKGRDRVELRVANSSEEFCEVIKELLSDQQQLTAIKNNAQSFVEERYSWTKATSELVSIIHGPSIS